MENEKNYIPCPKLKTADIEAGKHDYILHQDEIARRLETDCFGFDMGGRRFKSISREDDPAFAKTENAQAISKYMNDAFVYIKEFDIRKSDKELEKLQNGVDPKDEGINKSGLSIYDDRILVAIDKTEEKTAGGIILPDGHAEKEDMAQTYATVISVGRYAFDDMAPEHRPQSGDKILMAKYAGVLVKGPADGEPYRIILPVDCLAKVVS